MAIKTSDLVDAINKIEVKVAELTKQVNNLTAQMSERNAEAMKPKGLFDKIRAHFGRS